MATITKGFTQPVQFTQSSMNSPKFINLAPLLGPLFPEEEQ